MKASSLRPAYEDADSMKLAVIDQVALARCTGPRPLPRFPGRWPFHCRIQQL